MDERELRNAQAAKLQAEQEHFLRRNQETLPGAEVGALGCAQQAQTPESPRDALLRQVNETEQELLKGIGRLQELKKEINTCDFYALRSVKKILDLWLYETGW